MAITPGAMAPTPLLSALPEPVSAAPLPTLDWAPFFYPPAEVAHSDEQAALVEPLEQADPLEAALPGPVDPQLWLATVQVMREASVVARSAGQAPAPLPLPVPTSVTAPAPRQESPAVAVPALVPVPVPAAPAHRAPLPVQAEPATTLPRVAVAARPLPDAAVSLAAVTTSAEAPPVAPPPGAAPVLSAAAFAGGLAPAPTAASPLPVTAPLHPEARWGEQMIQTLEGQVRLQLEQRVQHATLRLDPPQLGSLEISVSHQDGRVQVHINASQGETGKWLAQSAERLRQELAEHSFSQAQVTVSSDGQGRQHSPRQPRWALPEAITEQPGVAAEHSARAVGSDVLITV